MLQKEQYLFIIISIGTGLLSLLGSVGIFISLIVQRKVERLQAILEELIDLAYMEEQNLTGTIYRIVQKYQMHYLLPNEPVNTIMYYIDATISLVVLIWVLLHLFVISRSITLETIPLLLPLLGAIIILIFFRKLLKYAVSPLDNPLLSGIIPPPTRLRSISFLSGYVNVSVKALLKQARFNLFIEKKGDNLASIILKEELSFDDFFYFITVGPQENPLFLGFGKILFSFDPDTITGKPTPLQHNINVPLGLSKWDKFKDSEIEAHFLLFPYSEKNPINSTFLLTRQNSYYFSLNRPETTILDGVVYKFECGKLVILENKGFPLMESVKQFFENKNERYYYPDPLTRKAVRTCSEAAYID